jgi:GH15 family glucan-1,4-alpha-glucosidase
MASSLDLAAHFDGDEMDATLLLLGELGFVAGSDPRFQGTVAAVERSLRRGSFLLRYASPDDFEAPQAAFGVCAFW